MDRMNMKRRGGKPLRAIAALAAALLLVVPAPAYADEPANADAVDVGVASTHELVGVGSVRRYSVMANVPGSYSNWLTDSEKQAAGQEKSSGGSSQPQQDAAKEPVRQGSGAVFTITDDVTGGLGIDAGSVEVTARDPDAPADEKPTTLTPSTAQDAPRTGTVDGDGNDAGVAADDNAKRPRRPAVNPDYTIQLTGDRNARLIVNLTRPEEQAGRSITVTFQATVYGLTRHLGNGANVTYTDPAAQSPRGAGTITTRSAILQHYEAQLVIRNTDENGNAITGASYTLIDHATGKQVALAPSDGDAHVYHVVTGGDRPATGGAGNGTITMPGDGKTITIAGLAADGGGAREYELREEKPANGYDRTSGTIRFTITPKHAADGTNLNGVDYRLDDNGLDINTISTLQRNRGDGTDLALGLDVQGAIIDGDTSQLSRTLTITSTRTGMDANSAAQRRAAIIAIGVLLILTGAALIIIRRLLRHKE